jgi:hypothetical protein
VDNSVNNFFVNKIDLRGRRDTLLPVMQTLTKTNEYQDLSLGQLAAVIRLNWVRINYGAVPYLEALERLESISDQYGMESAKSVALYFLSNATTWRGETARAVKAELNRRCKAHKGL